jgi:hypothetical protein
MHLQRLVSTELRRYPVDAPRIVLDIYPDQQLVIPHAPAGTQPLRFSALDTFLERFYQQHRRGTS